MATGAKKDTVTTEAPVQPAYLQRSLKIPVVLMLLYWLAYYLFGFLDVSMFPRFLSRAGAFGLALLGFLLWWFIRGPVRISYRFLVIGWIVVCAVISTFLMHRTVLPPAVFLLVLPLLLTLWTVWLLLARHRSEQTRLIGTLLVAGLIFVPGTLVRMEGLKGDGGSDFHWRWTKSSEDRFLEQAKTMAARERMSTEPLVASAEDWIEFRGPTRDGTVVGLKIASDWKQSPPKLVWRTRVGPAWSSMILVNGLLFTQEQNGETEVVSCFDAATGNRVWLHEDRERFEEQLGGIGPRATPTFANGRIYSLGGRGKLNCLDAATGTKVWSRDIVVDASAKLPTWGFSGSPLVVNNRVIVFAGGEKEHALVAYDEISGEIVWKKPAGLESYSSPQLMTIAGQPQILFLGDKQLSGYEPESGKPLWSYDSTAGYGRPVVQPRLVGDSQLLVSFIPDAGITRIEVKHQGDDWKASESWNSKAIKPDFSDFVHHEGYLYGFDGSLFCCVNLATGKRQWKGGRYGAGQVLLLVDQPLLLVLTEQGELVLVGVNPEKHTELSRFQAIEGKTWNHPAISNNKLFVRNAEEMACFELQTAG